MLEITGYLQLD